MISKGTHLLTGDKVTSHALPRTVVLSEPAKQVTASNCYQQLSELDINWFFFFFLLVWGTAGELVAWCSKLERKWWGLIFNTSIHISYAKSIKLNWGNLTFRVPPVVRFPPCSICTMGFYSVSSVLIVVLVYLIAALSRSFLPLCYPSLMPAQSFVQLIFSVHFTVQAGWKLTGENGFFLDEPVSCTCSLHICKEGKGKKKKKKV